MDENLAATPLTLGHILTALGGAHTEPIGLEDILVLRHTGRSPEDMAPDRMLEYTRVQVPGIFAVKPRKYWVVLVSDGGQPSRLYGVFENGGELARIDGGIHFDLRPSGFLSSLADRLVVEWKARRFFQYGESAAALSVLEIADRDRVPFPGFDSVRLTYRELVDMVEDRRYADWRVALKSVQGIYLITDSTNGKQYVGKADGAERILGRWTAYARDGHGGNVALRELIVESAGRDAVKTDHARHFVFSLLRVFGPSTSSTVVDAAESHYKEALMTRAFGLNRN